MKIIISEAPLTPSPPPGPIALASLTALVALPVFWLHAEEESPPASPAIDAERLAEAAPRIEPDLLDDAGVVAGQGDAAPGILGRREHPVDVALVAVRNLGVDLPCGGINVFQVALRTRLDEVAIN